MTSREEGHVLERAITAVAERAADAYSIVDEARAAGLPDDEGIVLAAKQLRLELLRVKGDLERELARLSLDCQRCCRRIHWVSGVGGNVGHWAHAEPAPDHLPVITV